MTNLRAAVTPLDEGYLDVGDGQLIYWAVSGNPDGMPAVALHGGPGSGMGSGRTFDPDKYLLVRFDQRGCGRSTPSAADPTADLSANTTHHLIGDIERLREHLQIDRWLVWGGSWGVTLALAYAQRFPSRIIAMVLVSVTMTRPQDVHWLYHEVGRYFPQEWDAFRRAGGGAHDRAGDVGPGPTGGGSPDLASDGAPDLVARYNHLLNHQSDRGVQAKAARDWCNWEDALLSLEDGWTPLARYTDPNFRMTFARLCAHYFSHAAWLEPAELLDNMHRLAGIPAVLIHGRLDLGGPADVPWLVAKAWPGAELHFHGAGHAGSSQASEIMAGALGRFAQLPFTAASGWNT